jgi:hypothetical protein
MIIKSSLVVGLLLWASTQSLAQGCSPGDFKNFNFRSMNSLTLYAFLSKMSQSDFQQNEQKIKTDIIIPYIDVPVSSDYQQMRAQLRQVERMTQVNSEQSYAETLRNIAWDELGLEAYKACLDAQADEAIIIEALKGTDPFAPNLIFSMTYKRTTRTPTVALPVEQVICAGCDDLSGLKQGDGIEQGKMYLFQVTRKPKSNLVVVVKVNGKIGQFNLPKPVVAPKKTTRQFSVTVAATNPVHPAEQLTPPKTMYCLPSDDRSNPKLVDHEEFIIGSAKGIKTGQSGPSGRARDPELRSQDEHQVCWLLDVVSYDIHNGFSADYTLSAQTIVPGE